MPVFATCAGEVAARLLMPPTGRCRLPMPYITVHHAIVAFAVFPRHDAYLLMPPRFLIFAVELAAAFFEMPSSAAAPIAAFAATCRFATRRLR